MKETFTIIYPKEKGPKKEKTIYINPKNSLVSHQKKKKLLQRPLRQWLSSLQHALQWSQIQKQLKQPQFLLSTAKRNWFGLAVFALLLLFFFKNSISTTIYNENNNSKQQAALFSLEKTTVQETNIKDKTPNQQTPQEGAVKENKVSVIPILKEEFIPPTIPEVKRKKSAILKELGQHARSLREQYIQEFLRTAQGEEKKFGIPTSITLGLAILNSDFGTSMVAQEGYNQFHITCDLNPIPIGKGMTGQGIFGGTCYTRYSSNWMSFRAHSHLLVEQCKTILSNSKNASYKAWAKALEEAGYFNQNLRTTAIIATIQTYNLNKFDNIKD